ncbi:SDR family NAD(P)-dependent oxidoreductase [Nocardia sp. BMG51109]|uniref:SDR family NAD(P)-dependent oxidoreductase n=1 Tax=Nocardia sp. BMG51109 TaxID=1056816 RepID=UPI0004676665|nr:SDR family NAD(P)-dependent oxidoreductase [Nocardia sp. BMG51109]
MHTLVMTGATSGIGRSTAAELLRRDPQLYLVLMARGGSGRATVSGLRAPGREVTFVETDLSSSVSIHSAVDTVRQMLDSGALPPLSGIVGNAGGLARRRRAQHAGRLRDGGLTARIVMRWITPVFTATPLADSVQAAGRKMAGAVLGEVSASSGACIDRTEDARSSDESYDRDRELALWEFAERVRTAERD